MTENITEDCKNLLIPPLLLQPLVENAVKHGIANLPEGGKIHLAAACENGRLSIVVENTFDPESTPTHRNGLGLANVRQRLDARYPQRSEYAREYDFRSVSGELVLAGRTAGSRIMNPATENKIGALIVDDEELARQVLRELLQSHPEIQVLAECANGFEAVKAVTEHKPDLNFSRCSDAEAHWIRRPRTDRRRHRRDFHDGLRSIRDESVRGPRGRLFAETDWRRAL